MANVGTFFRYTLATGLYGQVAGNVTTYWVVTSSGTSIPSWAVAYVADAPHGELKLEGFPAMVGIFPYAVRVGELRPYDPIDDVPEAILQSATFSGSIEVFAAIIDPDPPTPPPPPPPPSVADPVIEILSGAIRISGGGVVTLVATVTFGVGRTLASQGWTGLGVFASPALAVTAWTAPPATANQRSLVLVFTVTDNSGAVGSASVEIMVRRSSRTPPLGPPFSARGGYHVTIRGEDVTNLVIQGSVEINAELQQQPTASFRTHWPPGISLNNVTTFFELADNKQFRTADDRFFQLGGGQAGAVTYPSDFHEVLIDFPGRPYRTQALDEMSVVAYWTFDDPLTAILKDASGNNRPLNFNAPQEADVAYRAYERENAAVPHGAAMLFAQNGPGAISPALPTIGTSWTICGFALLASSSGIRQLWQVISSTTGVTMDASLAPPVIRAVVDGRSLQSGALVPERWYHVALRRSSTLVELMIDGVTVAAAVPVNGSVTVLDGQHLHIGQGTDDTAVALDEWGVFSDTVGAGDLAAAARNTRVFGGYVYGPKDNPVMGSGAGGRFIDINCVGYQKWLELAFVPSPLGFDEGVKLKEIVTDAFSAADVPDVFTLDGFALDITSRAVKYDYSSVAEILRDIGKQFNANVYVDSWGELQMRFRDDSTFTGLVLDDTNVVRCVQGTRLRLFANRIILLGSQGVAAVVDDAQSQADTGGVVARRIKDSTVETEADALLKANALLATAKTISSYCQVKTAPGAIGHIAPGSVVTLRIPQHGLDARVLVERVLSSLDQSSPENPTVEHRVTLTETDYEPLYADYWRGISQTVSEADRFERAT